MNKSRLLGAVCLVASSVIVNVGHADIVTYNFDNTNFSGFYTLDRSTASISTTADGNFASTGVYTGSAIDYLFTVSFPQFNFSQTYTPNDSNVENIANQVTNQHSDMSFIISNSSYSQALYFYVVTPDIVHPYDNGANPFFVPPLFDYYISDTNNLSQANFFFGVLVVNDINSRSYLSSTSITVTSSAIPIPPALWLFGSGLLGLIGIARRRS